MSKEDLLLKLAEVSSVSDVNKVYAELGQEADGGLALVQEILEDFTAAPDKLADEAVRKQLNWVFLYAGLKGQADALPQLMALVTAPGFAEAVPESDWLICEISRLFGVLSGEGATLALEALIVNGEMGKAVREQLFMTQVFRWIAGKDSDEVFSGVIERLIGDLPQDFCSPELIMAIIVNAVAVSGNGLREKVIEFYKSHEEAAGDLLSMANVRNFFEIGRPRLKAMMVENYMGMYGKEKNEIQRTLDFVPDPRNVVDRNRTTKPVVREEPKIGRNDPCPCGSGKKYKKCCGNK